MGPVTPRRPGLAVRLWLALYNQMLGLGWLYVLLRVAVGQLGPGFGGTWPELGELVTGLQLLVLLDVLHAGCGFWPPDPAVGILQRLWCKVGHRSEIFVTILLIGPAANMWATGPLVLTWALADVSRYQLYFLRSIGKDPPRWLAWLRYSDFIVQYPLNVVAEAYFVLCALPHLTAGGSWLGSYAPVAVAFQVYEWVIFVPAYRTLWLIRKRRLSTMKTSDAISMPDRTCLTRFERTASAAG